MRYFFGTDRSPLLVVALLNFFCSRTTVPVYVVVIPVTFNER